MHLLIVDDEPALLRAMARGMRAKGFTVTAVTSPAEAIAAFRSDPTITHIISDTEMPGSRRAGPDLYIALKDEILQRHVRFVGMTGSIIEAIQAPWKVLGIPFLEKPFSIDDALNILK